MPRPSQIVVLGEDTRHLKFAWHFLKSLGYRRHDVRELPISNGRGSGEQRVRSQYADSLKAVRARSARTATAFVVVIDADKFSVQSRQQQLAHELAQKGMPNRADKEAVTHLIPKWSIETWVLCLGGQKLVPENQSYKDSVSDASVKPAAEEFHKSVRSGAGPPAHFVSSLCDGLVEARRIPAR